MRLKRHYVRVLDQDTGQPVMNEDGSYKLEPVLDDKGQPVLDAEGTPVPQLAHIELEHTGSTEEQNFSVDLVATALVEGWMSIKDGKLTLHGKTRDLKPVDLVYAIKRAPGKYVVPKQTPTDPGYEILNHYECVLNTELQARYSAKTWVQRKEDLYLAMGLTPKRKGVARG